MLDRRAVVAGLLALGACAKAPAVRHARPGAPPVQLAVLGDSLALGTGAGRGTDGFAFRVYRSIAAARPGSEISNFGIGGSTASDVLRLQSGRLSEGRYDVILVCVGGNDVVRGVPPGAFGAAYRALLGTVRRRGRGAALVAVGVPDVSISPLFEDRRALVHALGAADDRAARAAAAAEGAAYVDLFQLVGDARSTAGFLSADRFHPSDLGHAAIAAAVLPAVRRALRDK